MNILFVTPTPPFPPTDGARLMVHQLSRVLSTRHTLHLVALTDSLAADRAMPSFDSVKFFPQHIPSRWRKWANSFFDELPLWVRVCASDELRAALSEIVVRNKIDAVHLDTGMMAQYAEVLENVPTVVAPHDSLTKELHDRAQNASDWRMRFVARVQAEKMRAYETNMYRRATRVCVVTAHEQKFLQQLAPDMPVRVIANGVDAEYFAPQNRVTVPDSIGFLGAMDYAPNQAAVRHFVENILPQVRRTLPDVTFTIIGRNPPPEIRALAHDAHIRVTGTVADVRPYVAAQSIMVCPILNAGGMKFKLLETLAMGKAVVATPAAAEGVPVRDQHELLLASDANEFAVACVTLLCDETLRARLEINAHAWAQTFSWENSAAQYEKLYQEAIDAFALRRA